MGKEYRETAVNAINAAFKSISARETTGREDPIRPDAYVTLAMASHPELDAQEFRKYLNTIGQQICQGGLFGWVINLSTKANPQT